MESFKYSSSHGGFTTSGGRQPKPRGARVLAGFTVIALYAILASGTSLQISHGVCYAAAGLLMLRYPPEVRVSAGFYGLGAALTALAALSLLPARWFSLPGWRAELEGAGLDTGPLVTPHPWDTLEHLTGMVVSVIAALYLLGHRVSGRNRLQLALFFCSAAALYTVVSMILYAVPVRPAWDPAESFGIFPNRNHTATFLSMGAVCGMGVLLQSIRHKENGAAMLAAVSMVVCLCGALGFSGSRGGVLLTCIGAGVWMAFLGPQYISRRTGAALAVLTAAAVAIFLSAETAVKPRLTESMNRISVLVEETFPGPGGGAGSPAANPDLAALDLRVPVMRETFTMLKTEPWCGAGLGLFRFVFPQYQAASAGAVNSSLVLHPENDWLWLAAEAGPGAAAALGAALLLAGRKALKGGGSESGWPVRLACVIAAFIVPFHGVFDVPGHRLGLAWSSMILLVMALRRAPEAEAGAGSRLFFRVAGLAAFCAGGLLLAGVWFKTPLPSSAEPLRLYAEARALYAADAAEGAVALVRGEPPPEYPEGGDKLSEALRRLDRAIEMTPLNPALHYFQGALALHFDDRDSLADAAFARQRRLEPARINVPLRQAAGWTAIDPDRTGLLWREALRRARDLEKYQLSLDGPFSASRTFRAMMEQVRGSPELAGLALEAAGGTPELLKIWVSAAPKEALESRMPDLLAGEMPQALREELRKLREKRESPRGFGGGKSKAH